MVKRKVKSKKGEETLVTTTLSNTRSLVTFLVAVALLLGLLFIFRTYSSVSEKTIEVKSEDDLTMAKQKLQEQVQQLQQDVGDLRALVT